MAKRKPAGASVRRAELAGNAALAKARMQRTRMAARRTRFLAWLYPDLARVPPLRRLGVLREARAAACRKRLWVRSALALGAAAAIAFVWLQESSQRGIIAGGLVAVVWTAHLIHMQIAMRSYIRCVAPSLAAGSWLLALTQYTTRPACR